MTRERFSIIGCLLAALVAACDGADPGPACVSAVSWPATMLGSASFSIVLHNGSDATLTVRSLALPDGDATRAIGATDREVLWWTTRPQVIAAGGFAEVVVQLAPDATRPARALLTLSDGSALGVDLPVEPPALIARSVRFSALSQAWHVNVISATPVEVAIDRAYLDGREIAGFVPTRVGADAVVCLALPSPARCAPGETHLVSLRGADGVAVDAVARVAPPFHVAFEFGDAVMPESLPRVWSVPSANAAEARPEAAIDHLADCPTHGDGTMQDRAWGFLRRGRVAGSAAPRRASGIHLCRHRLDDGLAGFGRIADVVRFNPFAYNVGDRARDLAEPARLLEQARANIGVGQLIALIPVSGPRDATLWSRVLLAMAHGVAGIHLRVQGAASPPIIPGDFRAPLARLRATLPLWDAAEQLGRIPLDDATAEAWMVQLAPRRLAIVVVDGAAVPIARTLGLSVILPAGARGRRLLDADGEELVSLTHEPDSLDLRLPDFFDATVVYVELADVAAGGHDAP